MLCAACRKLVTTWALCEKAGRHWLGRLAIAAVSFPSPELLSSYCLCCLQEAGYDLGPLPEGREALAGLGEALLKTLKGQEEPRTVSKGAAGALRGGVGVRRFCGCVVLCVVLARRCSRR